MSQFQSGTRVIFCVLLNKTFAKRFLKSKTYEYVLRIYSYISTGMFPELKTTIILICKLMDKYKPTWR